MFILHDEGVVLDSDRNPLIIVDAGDKRALIYGVAATELVIVTFVIACRFISRRLGGIPYWLDDWLIIPSYIGFLAVIATLFWFVDRDNGGRSIGLVTFQKLSNVNKIIFAWELLFAVNICTAKLSILAFYWRVFAKGGSKTKRTIQALALTVIAWVVLNLLFVLLQCQPIRSLWDKTIQAKYHINEVMWILIVLSINIVTDLVMLALPIVLCLRVHASWATRLALGGIFSLGFLVTIFSIVGITVLLKIDRQDPLLAFNIGWFLVPYVLLTTSANASLLLTACLPTIRPFLIHFWSKISSKTPKQVEGIVVENENKREDRRQLASPYSSPWSARLWGIEDTQTEMMDATVMNMRNLPEHIVHNPTKSEPDRRVKPPTEPEEDSMSR